MSSQMVSGQLLGMDITPPAEEENRKETTLEVTSCFPMPHTGEDDSAEGVRPLFARASF